MNKTLRFRVQGNDVYALAHELAPWLDQRGLRVEHREALAAGETVELAIELADGRVALSGRAKVSYDTPASASMLLEPMELAGPAALIVRLMMRPEGASVPPPPRATAELTTRILRTELD